MKEKKTLEEKYAKPGEELRTGTIVVCGVGFFLFLIMLYFSIQMSNPIMIIIGAVLFIFCILIVFKNIKGWIYGKRRESLLKSGKLKEAPKKSYNREHKFDEE